jgi:hypothetical protein
MGDFERFEEWWKARGATSVTYDTVGSSLVAVQLHGLPGDALYSLDYDINLSEMEDEIRGWLGDDYTGIYAADAGDYLALEIRTASADKPMKVFVPPPAEPIERPLRFTAKLSKHSTIKKLQAVYVNLPGERPVMCHIVAIDGNVITVKEYRR